MKTIVLQSYRTHGIPGWIATCLRSVADWARQSGFDHALIGDEFFDYAPAWARERCGAQIFPVTDLARLYLIRDYLGRGYDRAIWLDADVIVFAPHLLKVDTASGYAFSHEVMLGKAPDGSVRLSAPSINNAAMVFEAGNPMLEFYRFATEAVLRHAPPGKIERTTVGPRFLVALNGAMPIERLTSVGLFTPKLMADIAQGGHTLCAIYARQFGFPMGAANLCHFTRHLADDAGRQQMDRIFEQAISQLLTTQGEILNRHLQHASRAADPASPPSNANDGSGAEPPEPGVPAATARPATFTPPRFSIITTCKGRLHDLKKTLPEFLKQACTEVIVVDYDCPDGTAEYVSRTHPSVRLVKITHQARFNVAHARNLGAAQAKGEYLAFLDADVVIAEDFAARIERRMKARTFALFGPQGKNSVRGSCVVDRESFATIGGYDELLSGYEGEDLELYARLRLIGCRQLTLGADMILDVIEQDTEERERFRAPDLKRQFLRGQLYSSAKEMVMAVEGAPVLPAGLKEKLLAEVDRNLEAVYKGEKDFLLEVNLPDKYKRGFLKEWEFSRSITVKARRRP
ncbi:protein of unknown function [Sterolibacterium denitrificans]|uniref:Glycosyltransferase 2-like domain-containing protein n=1 Tax=Sterolibacterium denitrificans TaxID=157592 RepID=A0A7Z7HRX9_9PROT|nr:glycosyltransferase [Sterolibacterium denitrificans]SMB28503.1 protein of unknown function [Sterolibacterium denitrificans]